jgi:hypothetical protein
MIEPKVAPVEAKPRELPTPPAAVEPVAPTKIEPKIAPLEAKPRELPTPPAAVEPVAPTKIEPKIAPPLERAPQEAPPAPVERVIPPAERELAAPSEPLPRLRFGRPDVDAEVFQPRRDVLSPSGPGGSPHIDLEAARKRASEIVSQGSRTRGLLSVAAPPERVSKEGRAIAGALKPDCRVAYAGLGLLAVPPLLWSTIADGGCRW